MNYSELYYNVILQATLENRKKIKGGTYYERHHIVPRCMGGSNEKENLVLLTAREHFLCHYYLIQIHPESKKLLYALWGMCNQVSGNNLRDYSNIEEYSKIYNESKKKMSKAASEDRRGVILPREVYERGARTRTGQKREPYAPKELKFNHTCEMCDATFKSADVKGRYCSTCKQPRECQCGCGKLVRTPGYTFARGCKTRGKSYEEIYNTPNPPNGFKKGNKFGKPQKS